MNKKVSHIFKHLSLMLLIVPLLFLSGCAFTDWFKGKGNEAAGLEASEAPLVPAAGDEVLVSMKGKPIITQTSFEATFNQLLEDNPQLKSVLPLMPNAKHDVLVGMISQAVVDEYVKEHGLDAKAEYKKELANMIKSVKGMLNTKYFGLDHPVKVSDAEVKKFYEENKAAMPDLLLSHGGVKAMACYFDSEAEAKAFCQQAQGKDFAKTVADAGLKTKLTDFKFVNPQSLGIDTALRSKIVSIKKFPTIEVAKDSAGKYCVICATESEAPKYRPFEQVAAGIKQFVEKERRMEVLDKEINKLKEKYNVVVNESVSNNQAPDRELQEELQLPQPPAPKNEEARNQTSRAKTARSA